MKLTRIPVFSSLLIVVCGCSASEQSSESVAVEKVEEIVVAEVVEKKVKEDVTDVVNPGQILEKGSWKSLWTRRAGSNWPGFLGPTGDSKSPETGIITDWSDGKLKMIWQRSLGVSYGIGSVSHGRFYQFDRFEDQARLYCLHAETGEQLWQFEYETNYRDLLGYNNGPRCSPVIDGDRVYILGSEGKLHCLAAEDGALLWAVDTSREYDVVQNFFGVGSTPRVEGDLLICMVGGSPPGSPELYSSGGQIDGNGSGIVAFDKYSGEVRYEMTDQLASYAVIQFATIANRRWGFAFCREGLVGFEPLQGKQDFFYPWRALKLESVNASTPVIVGDEVFISETYQIGSSVVKVEPGRYEVVWDDRSRRRDKAMRAHWNTPIHMDGYLYGCSGRNEPDAELKCIEWKTGKTMWRDQLPARIRERSSLMYVDGHFVCLGEFGTLKLLRVNPNKYELVTEVDLREESASGEPRPLLRRPCWAAPMLAHGLLYVRGADRLVCLELIPQ